MYPVYFAGFYLFLLYNSLVFCKSFLQGGNHVSRADKFFAGCLHVFDKTELCLLNSKTEPHFLNNKMEPYFSNNKTGLHLLSMKTCYDADRKNFPDFLLVFDWKKYMGLFFDYCLDCNL